MEFFLRGPSVPAFSMMSRRPVPGLAARRFRVDRASGHVCMIIGHNKQTGEIAVSDSWGPEYAERWVTPEEARAVSQGTFQVINL